MSQDAIPAHRLLCEFRRHVGTMPLTARIRQMEWVAIAKTAGLSDEGRSEAIRYLLAKGFIEFTSQTTQIIALTIAGVELADQLITRLVGPRPDDPLPTSAEDIRKRSQSKLGQSGCCQFHVMSDSLALYRSLYR